MIGREHDRASPSEKQSELNSTLISIIKEIQKVTESSEEITRGGIHVQEVTTSLLLKWQKEIRTIRNASDNASTQGKLMKILVNTEDIKKQLVTRP
jgi:hypothetical protein